MLDTRYQVWQVALLREVRGVRPGVPAQPGMPRWREHVGGRLPQGGTAPQPAGVRDYFAWTVAYC